MLGPHGKVTGVDQSAAMLEVAARSTTDPRATWVRARAESVDQHVRSPIDAVICNSAIWQADVAATALAVRAVLPARGRFAFNVPAGFLADGASHRSGDWYLLTAWLPEHPGPLPGHGLWSCSCLAAVGQTRILLSLLKR